ncbi:MAG: acyltransferase [Muribaculaceae bacterium]|nr:acyltransferase [Muribaculaceae bacterium]
MTKLFLFIGYIFSWVYPVKAHRRIQSIKNLLYTGWYSRYFAAFGQDSRIASCASLIKGMEYITIGEHTYISKGVQLTAWDNYRGQLLNPEIRIGDGCSIGEDNHITAIDKIIIGNHVLTGKKVLITDNAHGISSKNLLDIPPSERQLSSKGAVIIEDNVWIGEKASILPGVHIGKGCIIGANAVVTRDIPPYSVVGGNPARIIKSL